jgi:flagellar protein FliJ
MSKTIQSTVQSILNFRKSKEDAQAIVLKNSKTSLALEEEKLKELENKKNLTFSLKEDKNDNNVILSINQLQILTDYQTQINSMIENQTDEIEKVLQKVEKDRDNLIVAAKDKKAIEKLRDRRLLEDLKTKRRKEEKVESEIAIRVDAGKIRIIE